MYIINVLLRDILLWTFYIFLSLVIFEILARIYIENFANDKRFLKYASLRQLQKRLGVSKYLPHRYLGFYPTPNYSKGMNRHNCLGYRGEEIVLAKPQDEFRIVCLGGSTTYTTTIEDYKLSYPALLEKELISRNYKNVKVINAGCVDWSSWESLINFQFRVLDLEPDMIVIYHCINDIHPRLVWPPEVYKGDNSGARGPLISQVFMPSILEYSTILRWLMIKMSLVKSHLALARTLHSYPETYFGEAFKKQMIENTYPDGIFKNVSAQEMFSTNKPIYFKRNIENIIAIAKLRGIKTILATFAYSSRFSKQPMVTSADYISAIKETNQVLEDIAKEKDVNLFDFASLFPQDKQFYIDGRHVTERGVRLKAKLFAQYIADNNLISKQD